MKSSEAFKQLICDVNTKYGAPMGRANVGSYPVTITRGRNCRICKCDQTKVYKCRVHLNNGGYDRGGAYWGLGSPLFVEYTADLSYVRFFRA